MECDRILEPNNKYNPSSNKIVYLDTFASREISQSDMFTNKFNHNNSFTNFTSVPQHNRNAPPNVSLFNKSLVSFQDLQQMLELRKRHMTEELLRIRNINKQLQSETNLWRKRQQDFRSKCEKRGLLTLKDSCKQENLQMNLAMRQAKDYLSTHNKDCMK